jgi:ubiquinone/menaquinone biosynthesis C-methylase UbiE
MDTAEDHSAQARATWAAGDWDGIFWKLITPVGNLVLERAEPAAGARLLDVGTGSGGNIAIPAARRGVAVTALDPTPELLAHGRRRAHEAGVRVSWVEGDALQLPFPDACFDVVISTFGAMFAHDHARAAEELVRVCASPGRVLMTTWSNDGFAGELFDLTGSMLPTPAPGAEPPSLWGSEEHAAAMFTAAGASPAFDQATVDFTFASVDEAVAKYAEHFGPFVTARRVLEPEGRWPEFLDAFRELVTRFNVAQDGSVRIRSEYLVITVER